MKTSKPVNWDFVLDGVMLVLRVFQIAFAALLLLAIVYISIQKGIESSTTQGFIFWLIAGIIVALVYGAYFVGLELFFHLASRFSDWLASLFGKYTEIRRRVVIIVALILFLIPFALFAPPFWRIVSDNLLRAIILFSPLAFSSALLSIAREDKARSRVIRLALLESTLSGKVPLLTDDDISNAVSMAEIYAVLHCYENSVRKLVEQVLSKELGDDWWNTAASDHMRHTVDSRQQTEQNRRWLSPRGTASPLYYLDWGDLEKLIKKYDKPFYLILVNSALWKAGLVI
jgi:hypothetical protein